MIPIFGEFGGEGHAGDGGKVEETDEAVEEERGGDDLWGKGLGGIVVIEW